MKVELSICKQFIVFIHNFNLETLNMLFMMKDTYSDKFHQQIWLEFGEEFNENDLKSFAQIMKYSIEKGQPEDGEVTSVAEGEFESSYKERFKDIFKGLVINIIIREERTDAIKILRYIPKINALHCHEDHIEAGIPFRV